MGGKLCQKPRGSQPQPPTCPHGQLSTAHTSAPALYPVSTLQDGLTLFNQGPDRRMETVNTALGREVRPRHRHLNSRDSWVTELIIIVVVVTVYACVNVYVCVSVCGLTSALLSEHVCVPAYEDQKSTRKASLYCSIFLNLGLSLNPELANCLDRLANQP